MNYMLVRRLMVKDWYMARAPLVGVAVGGAVSMGLMNLPREMGFIGIVSALISVVMLSNLIPQLTIINERKQQNLAFIMSLPITPFEYTFAKVLGNLSAFLLLWLVIVGTVLGRIGAAGVFGGVILFGVVVALA